MLKFIKQIRDPVHGWIRLTEDEVKLIDNLHFIQRLKYIYQLGFAYQVYPSARHTRFEHSLGVMHIATMMIYSIYNYLRNRNCDEVKLILESFNIPDQSFDYLVEHIRIAALLHDIGHLPFSHSLENIVSTLLTLICKELNLDEIECSRIKFIASSLNIAKEHEWILYMNLTFNTNLIKLIQELIPHIDIRILKLILFVKILRKIGKLLSFETWLTNYIPDVKYVTELSNDHIRKIELISNILSSDLDADRIDYMLRDLYFTGASVSTNITLSDVERVLTNLKIINDTIVFDEKARVCLEGFAIARYNLYKWVYLHHKVTLMTTLMKELMKLLIRNFEKISKIDDFTQFFTLLTKFVSGTIPDELTIELTDNTLLTLLIKYRNYLEENIGYQIKYFLRSLVSRTNYYRALWKRDIEFIKAFSSTFSDIRKLNERIDLLVDEWNRNPELFTTFTNYFINRLIQELNIRINDVCINSKLCDCLRNLANVIEKDNSFIVIGYMGFEPEIKIRITSIDEGIVDLYEISPFIKSIRDAWMMSPHIFIYLNFEKLSEICSKDIINNAIDIIKECCVNALISAINDYARKVKEITKLFMA